MASSDPTTAPSSGPAYLRTLPAVRARCAEVYALAQAGELTYFDLHEDKLPAVVDYCARIIQVCLESCQSWLLIARVV